MKGKKKDLNTSDRKPWNHVQMFFSGDDELSEWSDVLKIMYTWGRVGFIIRVQGGRWGSKYSIFWGNIFINDPYHKG